MHDRYFAIRLILRFGPVGAIVLAVLCGLGLGAVLLPVSVWLALALPLPLATFAYVMFKSYVEMVSIVFSMVH
jgi:hypothetical protein